MQSIRIICANVLHCNKDFSKSIKMECKSENIAKSIAKTQSIAILCKVVDAPSKSVWLQVDH